MSKTPDRSMGFSAPASHRQKVDRRIKTGSLVTWRRREFPEYSDGTTAGDRAGWLAIYQAKILKMNKKLPDVRIIKQLSIAPDRVFELSVGEITIACLVDLELKQ